MAGSELWTILTISFILLLFWIFINAARKTIVGVDGNNMEWYSRIVEDIPVLVAAILILSIIGFTIYAYFCRDIDLAEKFFEAMDAFATGVWGFLIGYGSGRVVGRKTTVAEEAMGTAEYLSELAELKSQLNEKNEELRAAKEVINSYTPENSSKLTGDL